MPDEYKTFHIGINMFVVKGGKLLLGKRKNIYGAGTWALPGGHLEPGEAMQDAARRELKEETGLRAKAFTYANTVNDRSGGSHYIQIGFAADSVEGDPENREPARCEALEWFAPDKLPKELFPAHVKQIELFLHGGQFGEG